eukprot:3074236-Amphidinium_carterae.1
MFKHPLLVFHLLEPPLTFDVLKPSRPVHSEHHLRTFRAQQGSKPESLEARSPHKHISTLQTAAANGER